MGLAPGQRDRVLPHRYHNGWLGSTVEPDSACH